MDERETRVRAAVTQAFRAVAPDVDLDRVNPSAPLREETDLDSVDTLNLLIQIHALLGVEVPEADLGKLGTLDALIHYLMERLPPEGPPSPGSGTRRGFLLALLSLLPAACWPWKRDRPGTTWTPQARRGYTLQVVSQNFADVVVYLIPDGQRRRLGMVGGLSQVNFDLEAHEDILSRPFRLAAEPIGSRATFESDYVSMFAGDVLVFTIAAQVERSDWRLRRGGGE
jgi:acyl carrier protein